MSKNKNYVPIGSIALHNFNSSMGYFNRNISIKTLISFRYFEIVLINNLTYKRFVYHINTCYPTSQ